ncbi:hypothetical protein CK203_047847 [Vitis vinifera]|uniref:Uncharacterized protein n=1 Tax=Vitis vinifera TaxID=29760 RepID=A0A438H8Q9_VITVI|nr:hypothetical protein CK203_097910 [Vitis vinifera]RVW80852.1 hypothetical protein CK203_047847 [Vitis vinifera]
MLAWKRHLHVTRGTKMLGVRAGVCIFALSYCCFVLLAVAETTSPSEGEFV